MKYDTDTGFLHLALFVSLLVLSLNYTFTVNVTLQPIVSTEDNELTTVEVHCQLNYSLTPTIELEIIEVRSGQVQKYFMKCTANATLKFSKITNQCASVSVYITSSDKQVQYCLLQVTAISSPSCSGTTVRVFYTKTIYSHA